MRFDVIFYIVLLARALLKSRSGFRNSDTVVNYLIRNVIQIGFFAMLWAIGELVTWFFLPKSAIYTVFYTTTGSMYTHVGGSSSLKTASQLQ